MSFVSEIAIEEKIPADARELDEFLRKPGKNYLEIKSGIENYAANRHNDRDLATIAVGTFNLKRKRGKEDTENSKEGIAYLSYNEQ
ncbi:MAG: hypothetical protein MMC33_010660 [Icmadophila ericetorum]|nr:hypothetical protein [Icmadophila ericetorum]